jgi:hypothetical protein
MEEFRNLYLSPSKIRMVKLRGMRWDEMYKECGEEECI